MVDPLPVGYVALDRAVTWLVRDISDQDVIEEYGPVEENSRRVESEDDNLAREGAPLPWSNFPEAERDRIAEQQKVADFSWAKREIAISRLYGALCDGDLTGLVCEDNVFFQLTPVDWCGVAFWHEIIISGVVRGAAADAIARHSGRRVLFEDSAFDAWLTESVKQRAQAAAAQGSCQTGVEAEMGANPARTTQAPKNAGSIGSSEPVASAKLPSHRDLGQRDEESTLPHRYLTAPQVGQRYTISHMTLWRWLDDTALAFPQPALRIRDRRYWLEADLVAWERSQIERQNSKILEGRKEAT
jgi:predicted DNA-binding transcriptional regulator AlpA